MKKRKLGIIGCGYWGINYVRVFGELLHPSLIAAYDFSAKQRGHVKRKLPLTQVYAGLNSLLDEKKISAVVVATPASTHFKIVKQCLLKGKHVLVEKPLTLKVDEAEELIALAEKQGRLLMIGHTFLYNPAVRKIKEYVEKDDFGRIYYLHATRTHLGLIREDVNAIWDLAPHDVSVFNYLIGACPLSVSAVGGRFLQKGKEDLGFITLTYDNNILGNIHVCWADSNKVRELVIVGNKERIVFNDLDNLEKIRIFKKGISVERDDGSFGEFQFMLRDGDIISPKITLSEPLKNQCSEFLECLENNKNPLADGANGLEVVKVMCAIEKSLKQEGSPVKI